MAKLRMHFGGRVKLIREGTIMIMKWNYERRNMG